MAVTNSFWSEYYADKKKKEEEEEKRSSFDKNGQVGDSFWSYYNSYSKESEKEKEDEEEYVAPTTHSVSTNTKQEDEESDGGIDFFDKGALENGVNAKNISKAILGTVGDLGASVSKGVLRLAEGLIDLGAYGVAEASELFGNDDLAQRIKNAATKDQTSESFKTADEWLDQYSLLGETSKAVGEGIGQIGAIMLTGGLGASAGLGAAGTTALTSATMGLSSMGSGIGEAYSSEDGATDAEAWGYGALAGAADAVSEMIFGGLGKSINALGFSKGLSSADDMLAKALSSKIQNTVAKNLAQAGVKATGEGLEEVLAGFAQAAAKKATYMSEKDFSDIVADENLLEQFVVGALTSSIAQAPSLHKSNVQGRDFVTGTTQNEQKVIDRLTEEESKRRENIGLGFSKSEKAAFQQEITDAMEHGQISTDLISEMFGGDTYTKYKDTVAKETEARKELQELYKGEELEAQLKAFDENSESKSIKEKLSKELGETLKYDRLVESFNEKNRRRQAFRADTSKYSEKQKHIVQKAMDSGVVNDTYQSHVLVDFAAKMYEEKGVEIDFTNNKKLKEAGFTIENRVINGIKTDTGISINVDSPRAWQKTIGHEITHVLEGDADLYQSLEDVMIDYAKSRKAVNTEKFENEYLERLYNTRQVYKSIEGYQGVEGHEKIKQEVVADMVGDYLFTDKNFVQHLSGKHRNLFTYIYDEVKYLLGITKAGTKEEKQLLEIKKAFEDAYRGAKNTKSGTQYSITEPFVDNNGNRFENAVLLDTDFFDGISPRNWGKALQNKLEQRTSENPFILPIFDENGNETMLQFASPTERVSKDGKSNHKVIDELSSTSDNISKLAVIHIDEVVSVSEENDPYYTQENKHKWLDKKGWLHRNANVINQRNGKIYNLTIDIAKTEDGRTILYATDGKIKSVGNVNVNSLKIKGSRQNTNTMGILPQVEKNVNRQFSISTENIPMPKTTLSIDPTSSNLQKDLQTVRSVRTNTMLKNGYTEEDVKEVNHFMDNLASFMEKAGVTYKFIGLEDVNNAKLKVTYDKNGNPQKITMSAMVKNGEYPVNFDFTRICKKRESMSMVIRELANRRTADGKRTIDTINLDAKALWKINEELRSAGLETACLGCFVESKRYNIQAFADKAVNMWNTIVDEVRQESGATGNAEYFNFAGGIDLDKVDYGQIEKIFADYNTVQGRTSPEARMRALIQNGGEIYQRYLQPSDLMTPNGIESIKALSTKANDFYGILKGVYGQAAPKEVMGFSPYNSEVALLPKKMQGKELGEYVASIGGVRMQSFSDFLVANVYDYMQMVADLSARHLPAHAYTKEIAFAKIFGMTGIKINMSVMFDIDPNLPDAYAGLRFVADEKGNEIYNGTRGYWDYLVGDKKRSDSVYESTGERPYVQSIGFDEAVALQSDPKYSKNCGIIGVGMSDNHIEMMLGDDRIRYVIPYHSSSLPAVIADVTNIKKAKDYTSNQNTRRIVSITDSNGNAVDIQSLRDQSGSWSEAYTMLQENIDRMGWQVQTESDKKLAGRGGFDIYKDVESTKNPRQSAENYLAYCGENGYMPVFEQFSHHENYYKLLFDFDPYDSVTGEYAPQTEVKNIYSGYNPADGLASTETIESIINEEMAKQNEINKARSEMMPSVVDNVLEQLGVDRNEVGVSVGDTQASLSMDDDIAPVRDGWLTPASDLRYDPNATDDIAPYKASAMPTSVKANVPDDETAIAEDIEGEDIVPSASAQTSDGQIRTVRDKLNEKMSNHQMELANIKRLRSESTAKYDAEIARIQAQYDGKKNKNTKVANNLLRRIERLQRMKANVDADYAKRESDIESRMSRVNDQLENYQTVWDDIERDYARIDRHLQTDIDAENADYNARLTEAQESVADKNTYISRRAKELYNELSSLKKGVRASQELGFLLDQGYAWKDIKSALLYVNKWSDEQINPDNDVETTVREALNEEYENRLLDIQEMETEHQQKLTDLEADAEEKRRQARVAYQRRTKQQQRETRMQELMGDTSTWKDKSLGISYATNTLRRNLRDIVRGADGKQDIAKADAIYDALQGTYNHNEAEMKRESERIKKAFFDMKLTSAENVYVQMLGELRHNPDTTLTEDVVNEYYDKHKNKIDTQKVDRAIELARQTYDELFERVNAVLKEQGMKEIPYRKGYFPHIKVEKQSWLAKLLNWKTRDDTIPTSIAGITETFEPNRSWQSFNKQRFTDETDYNFAKGFDGYVHGALDWIYHIEDIQNRRAFENVIRYNHSEEGIKAKIEKIKADNTLDADEAQEQIDLVLKDANNPLGNFISDFHTATNTLAGKKSTFDREAEQLTNRKFYSVMANLSNRTSANMVAGSVSSALTNFIPITQSWGEVSPISTLRGMAQTIANAYREDGVVEKSDFLTNRLNAEENLYQTGWDKVGKGVGILMDTIDNFTSQTIWRSKYTENISKGMSENEAIKNADIYTESLMAGRSRGNMPTIFDSKNPIAKVFTAFQLEVNNQYGHMFKDMPIDMKNEGIGKLIKGYSTMFLGAYAYNALYSAIVGRDAAFDPISIIEGLLRDLGLFGDDDEEKEPDEIALGLVEDIAQNIPFVGGILGGGRVPIQSALPYSGDYKQAITDVASGDWKSVAKELQNPMYYLLPPMAGGQIRKTIQGLSMFDDDLPVSGSYTDSGKLRFPVEDTLLNRFQAALFGQYASKNAREYFDEGYSPLGEEQIQEYMDTEMPISEYWDYRDGLKGLNTMQEKADYVDSLDLPTDKKNILINNLSSRKESIDMTDYGQYESLEEFDYANSNPEKYSFLQENDISYAEYKAMDDDTKDAWNWAYNNPDKRSLAKAVVGDVVEYRSYAKVLNDIRADKDANGKTINGSAKQKKFDYINGLDIDKGAKMILWKSEYPSDDSFNMEIIEYLDNRDDISHEEMLTILKELGFNVSADGRSVSWD